MASSLTFDQVEKLFNSLGVKSFGADLAQGRIHWLDEGGQTVAFARCQAVLSHAATNDSIAWAEDLPHFKQAGVPCLPKLDGEEAYQDGVSLELAQELATQAAQLTGAQFLYTAPSGGGGQLFLAVRDFTPGSPEEDPDAASKRIDGTRGWARNRLGTMVGVIREGRLDEAQALLASLAGEARNQAEFVVPGTDVAAQLEQLAVQSVTWAERVAEAPEPVAYELEIASRGFVEPAEA